MTRAIIGRRNNFLTRTVNARLNVKLPVKSTPPWLENQPKRAMLTVFRRADEALFFTDTSSIFFNFKALLKPISID